MGTSLLLLAKSMSLRDPGSSPALVARQVRPARFVVLDRGGSAASARLPVGDIAAVSAALAHTLTDMARGTKAVYYRDSAGHEPVNAFLDDLAAKNPAAAAKVDDYVEQYLNGRDPSAPPPEHPISSQVDGELRELRVRFGMTRYRLLYRRSGQLVVLLSIFEKNTDKLPVRERDLAGRRFVDFKARMDAERRVSPRAAGRDAPPRER